MEWTALVATVVGAVIGVGSTLVTDRVSWRRDTRERDREALSTAAALFLAPSGAMAQGVTTGSISGIVKDAQGLAVPGSTVLAVHQPSGSTYEAVSREDGRFSIPGMRVGGPYTVTASLEGFQPSVTSDVFVNLGVAADLTLTLRTVAVSETVTVVAESDAVFSSARTGASTAIARETLAALPTIGNRLQDFTRLTPQAAGTSFGGVDNRLDRRSPAQVWQFFFQQAIFPSQLALMYWHRMVSALLS